MADFQIVALDPTTPQLRAPGAADQYSLPRPINGANINYAAINVSAAFTLIAFYNGRIINCTANTFTITLPSSATLDAGFNCWINNIGTGTITLSSSGTIDGFSSIILRPGEGVQIYGEGATNWQVVGKRAMRAYAENMPSATRAEAQATAAVAIGNNALASGLYSLALGYSTASGLASVAIGGYGSKATASGSYSTAIGLGGTGNGGVSIGPGSIVLGSSYASGNDAFAVAIANNSTSFGATGTSSIALCDRAKATATRAIAIGQLATATAADAIAIGHGTTTAAGSGSVALGFASVADANYTLALGTYSRPAIQGKLAYASGAFASAGDGQQGTFVLRNQTAGTTPRVLTTDGSTSPGVTNQVILPNNSAHTFTGLVVARQQTSAGTQSAAWKLEGLIRRDLTAATTTLVASTVTAISNVPGWTLALSVDTTNGGLAVTATGGTGLNIRWVATVETCEVIYI
jgi:hypothetical protein